MERYMKTDGTNPPGQGIFGLIDINCHILPGTEDGPDNFREAAEMLRIAYDEGIRTIVATPPYNSITMRTTRRSYLVSWIPWQTASML